MNKPSEKKHVRPACIPRCQKEEYWQKHDECRRLFKCSSDPVTTGRAMRTEKWVRGSMIVPARVLLKHFLRLKDETETNLKDRLKNELENIYIIFTNTVQYRNVLKRAPNPSQTIPGNTCNKPRQI